MTVQVNRKKLQQFGMVLVANFNDVKVIAAREAISRGAEELLKGGKCVCQMEFQSCLEPLIEAELNSSWLLQWNYIK